MNLGYSTLPSLLELQKTLEQQKALLTNWFHNNHSVESDSSYQEMAVLLEQIKNSEFLLQNQVNASQELRSHNLQDSVELYWTDREMNGQFELFMKQCEIDFYEKQLNDLQKSIKSLKKKIKLTKTPPQINALINLSAGKLAFSIADMQTRNLESAQQLLQLQDEEKRVENRIETGKVAVENATSLFEYSQFEQRVLDQLEKNHGKSIQNSGNGNGLPVLEQLISARKELSKTNSQMDQLVSLLQSRLAKAIDLHESNNENDREKSKLLFQECHDLIQHQRSRQSSIY